MKKTTKTYLTGALVCAAAFFAIVACEKDEKSKPGAAGAITGSEANVCPAATVDLSVAAVENATAYQWYRNNEPIDGATATTYVATQTGNYTVAGVNGEGEGDKSAAKVVTITQCNPPTAGAITGSETNCPAGDDVLLTASNFTGADSYKWYKDNTAISGATAITYTVTETGTYTVAGVNVNGEGDKSAAHVVTIVDDCTPTPAAAGTITVTPQDCPAYYKVLSIDEIENATAYQWYRNDEPITGATASTYLAEITGSYQVAGVNDALDQGEKSGYAVVQIVPCEPEKPMRVHLLNNPSASSITSCTLDGGTTTIVLSGQISARATSYTWYITRPNSDGTPVPLETREYNANDPAPALSYTATETGTYTTTGSNDWGTSEYSAGFYFELKTLQECAISVAPQEAPGNFRITTSAKIDNGDGSWSNDCSSSVEALSLGWNEVNGASSYVVRNLTTSGETVTAATTKSYQVKLGNDGTYTVRARNLIDDGPESEGIAIRIVECPLGAPSFAKKPAGNNCPATVAIAEVNAVNNAAGYEWYKNEAPAGSVTAIQYTNATFTITETGTYTVKAISASGMRGAPSESINVTINTNCANVSSRDDLFGAWDVADLKKGMVVGTQPWTYAVTIAAGSNNDEIIIGNFADNGSGGATVTANVVFDNNGSRYGTITIPEQQVTKYAGNDVTATFSKASYSWMSGTTYGGNVTADIVAVGGKLYFKLNDKFAIKPVGADALVSSFMDNADALAAFTKQ